MKKILWVLFLALMTSVVFTECTCNNSKTAQSEQNDDMMEEEENFDEEEEIMDSLMIEMDSIEYDEKEKEE